MPLASAAANILASFAFQLSVSGARGARLAYAARYWARYLAAKRLTPGGGAWEAAHHAAMDALAASGDSARAVVVRLPSGELLELDLFTCFMILKDIVADATYASAGFAPRPGQVVFDVGGQQGVFAVLAAKAVGPAGRVVSVEPAPANFARLTGNLSRNGLANAVAVNAALGEAPGRAELTLSAWNSGGHSLTARGGPTVTVEVDTLDRLAARLGLTPDLVKVDVEGAELSVLRGGLETLRARKPAVVLEADAAGVEEGVRALLAPLGYSFKRSGPVLFAVPEAR